MVSQILVIAGSSNILLPIQHQDQCQNTNFNHHGDIRIML